MKMKKLVALILAAVLVFTMGIAVFARYEVCPECHGRMVEITKNGRPYLDCTNCPYGEYLD